MRKTWGEEHRLEFERLLKSGMTPNKAGLLAGIHEASAYNLARRLGWKPADPAARAERVCELYREQLEAGYTDMEEIARETGYCATHVGRILKKAGFDRSRRRERKGVPRPTRAPRTCYTNQDWLRLKRLLDEGLTHYTAAAMLGMRPKTAYAMAYRRGWRSPGPAGVPKRPVDRELICELYREQLQEGRTNLAEVARQAGCVPDSVKRILMQEGIYRPREISNDPSPTSNVWHCVLVTDCGEMKRCEVVHGPLRDYVAPLRQEARLDVGRLRVHVLLENSRKGPCVSMADFISEFIDTGDYTVHEATFAALMNRIAAESRVIAL